MNSQTIVGDSSRLISLSLIGQPELLPKLYRRVLIPLAVWNEVTVQGAGLPGAQTVSDLTWLDIEEPVLAILQSRAILVDRGEAEAITPVAPTLTCAALCGNLNPLIFALKRAPAFAAESTRMNTAIDMQIPGVFR